MTIKNIVSAGDFKDYAIICTNKKKGLILCKSGLFVDKKEYVNKDTVDSYELIDEQQNKSVASGVARGIVGGALFGGVGAIAGAASAKTKGIHTVSITFKNGKKSLCVLDDFLYNTLIEILY